MIEKIIFAIFLLWLPFQLGRHFWPKEAFLFALKMDFLSPIFYFQDLLIIILITLFFAKNHPKNVFRIICNKKCLILGSLYLLLATLNISFSATPLLSFFSWLRITEMVVFGLIVSQRVSLVLGLLGRILPFSLIFEFILGLVQVFKQSSLGIFWIFGERSFNIFTPGIAKAVFLNRVFLRPYGTFSHPNSLAGFTLIAIIFLFGKEELRFFDKAAIILGLLLIILSFSRTVWLTAFILGVAYFIFKLKEFFKHKKFSLNYSYLILAIFLPLVLFFFSKTTFDFSSFTLRRDLVVVSLALFKETPLLGVGAGQFIVKLSRIQIVWPSLYWLQPVHNIFLLMVSETGLIGLLVFLAVVFFIVKSLLLCCMANNMTRRQDSLLTKYRLTLITALFAIFFTGLFDHYWLTLIQNQLLFTLVLGLSFGLLDDKMKR